MSPRLILVLPLTAVLIACDRGAAVTGERGAKLTLDRPAAVTLVRGGSGEADISIRRNDLAGDVKVRFEKLPHGVEPTGARDTISGDGATFTLRATDAADLVEHHVAQVTVTAPDGTAVTQPIEISVIEKLQ